MNIFMNTFSNLPPVLPHLILSTVLQMRAIIYTVTHEETEVQLA